MYLKHESESFLFFSKCKLADDYIAMILISPFTPRSSFREMICHSNLNLSKIQWCMFSYISWAFHKKKIGNFCEFLLQPLLD